jgi:hypothetical protein
MPALPKPAATRRRRGPADRLLPAEGSTEPAPDLPEGSWTEETRQWWADVWSSPMAAAWIESDYHAAVRLARIKQAIVDHPEKAALHGAASALEDRLGLSPRARRALNWRIVDTPAATERPASVSRIRAV